MTREQIRATVGDFLAFIRKQKSPSDCSYFLLVNKLDRLAMAYHFIECEIDATDYPEPPEKDYLQTRRLVEQTFPKFGYYNTPSETMTQIAQAKVEVADAIDDLADIILDLEEIHWRWEHTSAEDALWHYRFNYEIHWGLHLRSLQLYLHHLLSESGRLMRGQ